MSAPARLASIAIALLSLVACGGGDDLGTRGPGGALPEEMDSGTTWPSGGAAGEAGGGSGGADAGAGGAAGASGAPATANTCPRVHVDVPAGEVLNVRSTPSTSDAPVGTLDPGEIVDVLAEVQGEVLDGNNVWYQIKKNALTGYVWSGLATCTTDEPPEPPAGFYLPLVCGKTAKVTQGNFGSYSHQGLSAYAFDFSLGIGTPMVAMADGTVQKSTT